MFRISQKLVVRKFVDASAKRSMSTKLSEGFNLSSEHAVAITAVVGLFGTAYGVITSIVSKDLKNISEKIQAAQNQHEKDLTHIGEKIDKDFEIARNQSRSDCKVARDQLNTDFSNARDQTAKEFRDARDQTAKDFSVIREQMRDKRDQNSKEIKDVRDENLKRFDTIEQSLVAIAKKLDQK
jgi:hypothetical protein